MTDHNPYVGIQRTVFEQGWKRGLRELEKRLIEMLKQDDIPEARKIGMRDAIYEIADILS